MSHSSTHDAAIASIPFPARFETYRERVDVSSKTCGGTVVPMPRVGIFHEDDYNRSVEDPDSILDSEGLPLVVPFSTAYPNTNIEGYPGLARAGYITQPVETINEENAKRILDTRFDNFIAEIVATNVLSYASSWEEVEARLDTLHADVAASQGPMYDRINWGIASPFDGDGRPVVHHILGIAVPDEVPAVVSPDNIVDDFISKDTVRFIVDGLARHHIDTFSEHSKTASLMKLDHADEIAEMLMSPAWNVVAHMSDGEVDCATLITRDRNSTPYINPESVPIDGMFSYVDSISTSERARREGLALGVLIHALKNYVALAKKEGYDKILVPFDTSGASTSSVPRLAHAVFEAAGLKIATGRVDVITHVLIQRKV